MQLEEGYYSFRAVGVNSQGEMGSLYSRSYFIYDSASEKIAKQNYVKQLQDWGWQKVRITHTRRDVEDNNYDYIF